MTGAMKASCFLLATAMLLGAMETSGLTPEATLNWVNLYGPVWRYYLSPMLVANFRSLIVARHGHVVSKWAEDFISAKNVSCVSCGHTWNGTSALASLAATQSKFDLIYLDLGLFGAAPEAVPCLVAPLLMDLVNMNGVIIMDDTTGFMEPVQKAVSSSNFVAVLAEVQLVLQRRSISSEGFQDQVEPHCERYQSLLQARKGQLGDGCPEIDAGLTQKILAAPCSEDTELEHLVFIKREYAPDFFLIMERVFPYDSRMGVYIIQHFNLSAYMFERLEKLERGDGLQLQEPADTVTLCRVPLFNGVPVGNSRASNNAIASVVRDSLVNPVVFNASAHNEVRVALVETVASRTSSKTEVKTVGCTPVEILLPSPPYKGHSVRAFTDPKSPQFFGSAAQRMRLNPRSPEELVFHIYVGCNNCAYMLPLFFRHYQSADKIVLILDREVPQALEYQEIVALVAVLNRRGKAQLEIRMSQFFGYHGFERSVLESAGAAHFVANLDIDEFLHFPYHPDNMKTALFEMWKRGVTAARPVSYAMIETDPDVIEKAKSLDESIVYHSFRGHRDLVLYDKPILFNPSVFSATHYDPARHQWHPIGRDVAEMDLCHRFLLLHYRNIGKFSTEAFMGCTTRPNLEKHLGQGYCAPSAHQESLRTTARDAVILWDIMFPSAPCSVHHAVFDSVFAPGNATKEFLEAWKLHYGFGALEPEMADESPMSTALHQAARSQRANAAVLKLLVDLGLDIDAQNADGQTALHLAVIRDSVAVVEMLLVKGADWNIVDRDYRTPLMLAIELGRKALVASFTLFIKQSRKAPLDDPLDYDILLPLAPDLHPVQVVMFINGPTISVLIQDMPEPPFTVFMGGFDMEVGATIVPDPKEPYVFDLFAAWAKLTSPTRPIEFERLGIAKDGVVLTAVELDKKVAHEMWPNWSKSLLQISES